jgi:hypothetical protein
MIEILPFSRRSLASRRAVISAKCVGQAFPEAAMMRSREIPVRVLPRALLPDVPNLHQKVSHHDELARSICAPRVKLHPGVDELFPAAIPARALIEHQRHPPCRSLSVAAELSGSGFYFDWILTARSRRRCITLATFYHSLATRSQSTDHLTKNSKRILLFQRNRIHFCALRLIFDSVRKDFEAIDDLAGLDFGRAWTERAARRGDFLRRAAAAGVSPLPFAPATMACSASEGIMVSLLRRLSEASTTCLMW